MSLNIKSKSIEKQRNIGNDLINYKECMVQLTCDNGKIFRKRITMEYRNILDNISHDINNINDEIKIIKNDSNTNENDIYKLEKYKNFIINFNCNKFNDNFNNNIKNDIIVNIPCKLLKKEGNEYLTQYAHIIKFNLNKSIIIIKYDNKEIQLNMSDICISGNEYESNAIHCDLQKGGKKKIKQSGGENSENDIDICE